MIGSVIGLLKSGTTISGGTLTAFEQRAYVVAGIIKDSIAVRKQDVSIIVGIPQSAVLGVAQQRAYAIVYP